MQFLLRVTECADTPLPPYRYVLFEWSLSISETLVEIGLTALSKTGKL